MANRKATRNAQGDGTIRKRTDGRWEARVFVGVNPGTGKPIRKSLYGRTQKEVLLLKRELQLQLDSSSYIAPQKTSVGEWVRTWLTEYTGNIKASSRVSYDQHIKNHIIPALGAVKLTALTAPMVQRFYNDLQRGEQPLSAKTIKNVHGVLHQALKQAVKLGYIRANVTEACTLPRIEKPDMHALDIPQIRDFVRALDNSEYSILLKVDLYTGMREGEILGLQWSCVDFERGQIFVNKQLSRPRTKGDEYRLTSLKNDKPRTIRIAPSVVELLRTHRKEQLERRMQLGSLWDDEGFPDLVFTGETGKHLCYNVVIRHYRAALKAAGLSETFRFHDLRHTYAVNSIRIGDDIKTVQGNLGHATAAFTLDVYGHVTDGMKDASAQRMEGLIEDINS